MKDMKSAISLLCVCMAGAVHAQQSGSAPIPAAITPNDPIVAEEINLWRNYGKEDFKALAAELMPDYLNVSDVIRSRQEFLDLVPTCTLDRFDLADSKVTRPDATTAVIVYRLAYSVTCDHKQANRKAIATTVWVRRNDHWFAQLHTETPTTASLVPNERR